MGSEELSFTLDELRLAWRRVKSARPDRCFVESSASLRLVEQDRDGWLKGLQEKLAGGYEPRPGRLCLVPKARSLLRPVVVLELDDEVVYNALLGRLLPLVLGVLKEHQGDPDVAYQLAGDPGVPRWVRSDFPIWRQWRERSVKKLDEGYSYVLVADVAGFYDNIDLRRLLSALKNLDADSQILNLLNKCLRRWAHPRGRGIPQGYSASDILAKLYMYSLDRTLRHEGYVHLRYVDDIRLFCRSKIEGKSALRRLTEGLHGRGLTLQSAKTDVLDQAKARVRFDGVTPIIEGIRKELVEELETELEIGGPYIAPRKLAILLEQTKGSPPEVLERAFLEHFTLSGSEEFDKTLFHFLLARLAGAGSRVAVDYCVDTLRVRPEETEFVLRYLRLVGTRRQEIEKVVTYMGSDEAIYDYQLHQIVDWFLEEGEAQEEVLALCRRWAFDQNRDPWLRESALLYVGKFGESSDLEMVEERFSEFSSDTDRSHCVLALSRLESGRRNAFFGRIKGDSELVSRAIRLVKSSRHTKPDRGEN